MQTTPLVVVCGAGPWSGRATDALLRAHGYRLRRVTEADGLAAVIREQKPDLIVLTPEFQVGGGIDLCRSLRKQRGFATTPIFFLCAQDRATEVAAIEAGAWDVVRCPPDPQLFLARVRNAVSTKRKTDDALRQGLIDPVTGCYNEVGLRTRLHEQMLHARRENEPLACFVVELEPLAELLSQQDDPETSESTFRAAASLLRRACRRSDIVGRHGELNFGIVAPASDREASHGLAARLWRAFENSPIGANAGVSAVVRPLAGIAVRTEWPPQEEPPEALIDEAWRALAMAKAQGVRHGIYSEAGFDQSAS